MGRRVGRSSANTAILVVKVAGGGGGRVVTKRERFQYTDIDDVRSRVVPSAILLRAFQRYTRIFYTSPEAPRWRSNSCTRVHSLSILPFSYVRTYTRIDTLRSLFAVTKLPAHRDEPFSA